MVRSAYLELAFIGFAVLLALGIVALVVDVWVPVVTVSAEALESVSSGVAEASGASEAGSLSEAGNGAELGSY